jgi:hypothetical protein
MGTVHYHGGPISPVAAAHTTWTGHHAFVSYAHPGQVELAAAVTRSFALDNGAFSMWKADKPTDWPGFYRWAAEWLEHPGCDWAVIPDVIGGSEDENDRLVADCPLDPARAVPVWHLNESIDRLVRLAEGFPRVALGSCAEYDVARPSACLGRLYEVLPAIADAEGRPLVELHGLRMLNRAILTRAPLASADSTNVARNVGIDLKWPDGPAAKHERADVLARRIESAQAPAQLPLTLGFAA